MADLQTLAEALIKGDKDTVASLTQAALDEGMAAGEILNDGLVAGMAVIGKRFKANEVYVPEVLIAARAMHAGMDVLAPALAKAGVEPKGTVVLGTVSGDLHDIGKNLVGMMLTGGGWKVVDIGIDATADAFVEAAQANNAQVIAMSALLTTTMPQMKAVVEACKSAGLSARTIIGGAPVTASYAEAIGADAYAADAASAVDAVAELVA